MAGRGDLLRHKVPPGLGGITLDPALRNLEPGAHTLPLKPPDGKARGETIVVTKARRPDPPNDRDDRASPADVAVIVPVCNAAEDVTVCIDRLARFTPPTTRIVFTDDTSPDPAMTEASAKPGTEAPLLWSGSSVPARPSRW